MHIYGFAQSNHHCEYQVSPIPREERVSSTKSLMHSKPLEPRAQCDQAAVSPQHKDHWAALRMVLSPFRTPEYSSTLCDAEDTLIKPEE